MREVSPAMHKLMSAVIPLLLLAGCSLDTADVDRGFNLVDDLRIVSIVPAVDSASGFTEVHLRGNSRCAGRGWLGFSGRCGGATVGVLHAPVEGVVGSQVTQMDLPAGPFVVRMEVEVACDLQRCAIDVIVQCDSLFVDGGLVGWDSAEGRALYGDAIPGDTAFIFNQTWVAVMLDCPVP